MSTHASVKRRIGAHTLHMPVGVATARLPAIIGAAGARLHDRVWWNKFQRLVN